MTRAEYLRRLFIDHVDGRKPVRTSIAREVLRAEDRAALATFSRHAGRLTGALIQTAKAARLNGGLVSYHAAVEALLAEARDLKGRIDHLARKYGQ